jgi:citrate lyase subunit gamma (acyl carrier protein)
MKLIKEASAGTLESSDVYVEVSPTEGLSVEIESVVYAQFADAIRNSVMEVLQECNVENAHVHVVDRGALDCVLRARVETALLRGGEE